MHELYCITIVKWLTRYQIHCEHLQMSMNKHKLHKWYFPLLLMNISRRKKNTILLRSDRQVRSPPPQLDRCQFYPWLRPPGGWGHLGNSLTELIYSQVPKKIQKNIFPGPSIDFNGLENLEGFNLGFLFGGRGSMARWVELWVVSNQYAMSCWKEYGTVVDLLDEIRVRAKKERPQMIENRPQTIQ